MNPVAASPGPASLQLLLIVVVLALALGASVWLLRRAQRQGRFGLASRRVQVLEVKALGPRHKLVLVRLDDREALLGVAPNEIRPLGEWQRVPPASAAGES